MQHTQTSYIVTEKNAELYQDLNKEQSKAVKTIDGALLVLAGAGTGKTKVLTTRIANILQQGHQDQNILAVTFTNKAAKEMQQRITGILGYQAQGLWLGTFHSICAKILRRYADLIGFESNYTIIDTSDQLKLLKDIIISYDIDEKKWPAKQLLGIISSWKDRGLSPEKITASETFDFADGKAVRLYKTYQKRLRDINAMDFGDLMLHCLTLFFEHPEALQRYQQQFSFILVDEYQDTNVIQYLWLRLLSQGHQNICCVGDDDQSIYGWRGAEVGNILRFEKDFEPATIIRLEQNYRSTSHILAAASGLIAHNNDRLGKTLWTQGNEGAPVKLWSVWNDLEEARHIADEIEMLQQRDGNPLDEIAVLVRAGFQTRTFEECFLSRGIPYRVIGGLRFYERQEIRDVIAYLRLIVQPNDDLAFERIINTPKRGIGPGTLRTIRKSAFERGLSMLKTTIALVEENTLPPKLMKTLQEFCHHLNHWNELASTMDVSELASRVVEETGYIAMWKEDKTQESSGRIENIRELLVALDEFVSLEEFLEHVSLVTEIETTEHHEMVNVMTLHAAKGLEFDSVFLPGWEEGVFPHQRSTDEKGSKGVEEERRLAYVGITRAKKRSYISYAGSRRQYGQFQNYPPSRFISEIPPENCERITVDSGFASATKQQTYSSHETSLQPKRKTAKPAVSSTAGFKIGDRVSHTKFGLGMVVAVQGSKLDIVFDSAGLKKLMDDFVSKT